MQNEVLAHRPYWMSQPARLDATSTTPRLLATTTLGEFRLRSKDATAPPSTNQPDHYVGDMLCPEQSLGSFTLRETQPCQELLNCYSGRFEWYPVR